MVASDTRAYAAWRDMKSRCYNSKHPYYKDYGGRGIKVCDEWKDSFETFFKDMGGLEKISLLVVRITTEITLR